MKNAIDWIKSNPFNVAAGVIAVIGLAAFGYLYFMAAPSFSASRSEEIKKLKSSQRSLMNIDVRLPNEDPNAEPYRESVVVNQKVIDDVGLIYGKIQNQYEQITLETSDKNAANHRGFMLGGEDVFPGGANRNFALDEEAVASYRQHFKDLFSYDVVNNRNIPSMRASSPPTPEEIQAALEKTGSEFIRSIGVSGANALTKVQAQQLFAEQRMQLMKLLTDRARSIHLYASLPKAEDVFAPDDTVAQPGVAASAPGLSPLLGGGSSASGGAAQPGLPADYPFTIEPWAFAASAPQPDELWEGQVQLWIMRDVMFAIHKTNRVGKTVNTIGPDGSLRAEEATVLNSPIKRLIRLEHIPGYVGLHTVGGLSDQPQATSGTGSPFGGSAAPSFGAATGLTGTPSIYSTPPIELKPKDPTAAASEHFGITPTGRVCNSVFDVRHSRLTIDIEWQALSRFMQQLHATNFMTVIQVDIDDVDEYEVLQYGYIYGQADVVRVELLIESLWFREWTADLMPKVVREKLLIDLPEGLAGADD